MAVILVTGSNGQLGSELKELSTSRSQHQFHFLSKDDLDISNRGAVADKIKMLKPNYCINCAAYTAVDKAEVETNLNYAINAVGVENLATACKEIGAHFIHISTDYVFNGRGNKPYKEDDTTDPVNAYGAAKLKGELLALNANSNTIIIRTSWVYSFYGANFVKTMLRLMASKPDIGVVADQIGSPTYAADLAEAIMHIINTNQWKEGIYHFSNDGTISWFDFAVEIKNVIYSNCIIHPIITEQYPTPAKRPAYSVMDKTKFQKTFNFPLKNWKDSLQKCLHQLKGTNASF